MKSRRLPDSLFYLLVAGFILFSWDVPAQKKKEALEKLEVEADTLLSREDFQGALGLYNKIVRATKLKKDDDYKILSKRAYAWYGLGELENALRDVNQFLRKFHDPQAVLLRAYLNQEIGNTDDLLADLNMLIDMVGDHPDLLRWRSSVLLDAGKYREAQQDIRALLSEVFDPELQLYLGLAHYYLDNTDSALLEFDKLIEISPSFIQSYAFAASIGLEQENYELAMHYIDQGLQQAPGNATIIFYKGIALAEMKELDEACSFLRKAFDKGVDDAADYLKEYCFGLEK